MANKLPPVRYVKQLDVQGCACAAIASVVGVTYHDVVERTKKLLGNRFCKDYPDLHTKSMIKVIRSFGFSVKKTTKFNRKKDRAILALKFSGRWYNDNQDSYHCIVWDPAFGGRIIDPAWEIPEERNWYRRMWYKANKETLIIS